MMIKKKTKDTMRKNVARSSVIMMTHPPLLSEDTVNPEKRIGTNHDVDGRYEHFGKRPEHRGDILPRLRSLGCFRLVANL